MTDDEPTAGNHLRHVTAAAEQITAAEQLFAPATEHPANDAELAAAAVTLTAEIAALNLSVDALQKAQETAATHDDLKRRDRGIKVVAASVAVVAIVAVVLIVLIVNQQSTTRQIQAQQRLLTTSVHEQCALYGLVLPSYSDAAKARSPLGPDAYTNAYRRIQISADNLHCGIPHKVPGT